MESDEFAEVLRAHQVWLDSTGKEGKRANLQDVIGKIPDISGANLREANLNDANLANCDLTQSNFQGAELRRANFAGARLRRTNLREADLQNANLETAEFLLSSQLAGANVAGAKLPPAIAQFEGLEVIAEATSNAQKLFIAMLSGCLYSWLTIGTTTDAALLTNSASSPLPIIGTALPIVGFYLVAPGVLLALYFYFHLNMQRLWEALADLPAIFPDGKSLDKRADPWLLNGLVSAHFVRLRDERPSLSRVQQWLSILLAWWAVPATLFVFWGRFLVRHDWFGTGLHVGSLAAAMGFGWMSYRLACSTLWGMPHEPFIWANVWKDIRTYKRAAWILGTSIVTFIFYYISLNAVEGVESYKGESEIVAPDRSVAVLPFESFDDEKQNVYLVDGVQDEILINLAKAADLKVISRTSVMRYKRDSRNLREIARTLGISHIVEGSFRSIGGRFRLNVQLLDARTDQHIWAHFYDRSLEEMPSIASEIAADIVAEVRANASLEAKEAVEEARTARSAHLLVFVPRALNVIGFSPFANLVQADVSIKPLNWTGRPEEYPLVKGARLGEARMQFANARSAFLVNADLFHANLDGANLDRANLDHAKLENANLSNTFAPHVNLSWAYLENANMSNAYLENAHLSNANLENAELSGADLFEANLSNAVIHKGRLLATRLENANLSQTDLSQANLENATLSKAKLFGTHLEDANLHKADLSGAELLEAHLENARVAYANLSNANLSKANLSNAELFHTNLSNTILDGTVFSHTDLSQVSGLTRGQLQKSITDEKTVLPGNLPP